MPVDVYILQYLNHNNTLGPEQNGRHFTGKIIECIFMNTYGCCILTQISQISLKFVHPNWQSINVVLRNGSAPSKPLLEPMMTRFIYTYIRHQASTKSSEYPLYSIRSNGNSNSVPRHFNDCRVMWINYVVKLWNMGVIEKVAIGWIGDEI